MKNTPESLLFLPTHQWVKIENGNAIIGITDYAQKELGSITWMELPENGSEILAGMPFGSAESIKAVADIISPVTGKIYAVNKALEDHPELCNSDPYGKGWIAKVNLKEKPDNLLTYEEYAKLSR